MRIGVLTSGGDAPGMNAAIRSVVKVCHARGHTPLGIRMGYEGLLAGTAETLSLTEVDGISRYGGTLLGSARSAVFPTTAGQAQARWRCAELALDGLVVIGGNGSLAGAHALAAGRPLQVVGLPASIDNDIGHTRLCIGVDTAVNTIVEACDRISDTARAHRRCFVVEVMGRHCGYLAMRAGIAADADAILFAESREDEDATVARLQRIVAGSFTPERDKKRVLIIKAEGVDIPTERLVARLQECTDVEVRLTVLGHIVRGGNPSATDRVVAQRLAVGAVLGLEKGLHDAMMAWEPETEVGTPTTDPSVRVVPLDEVLEETGRLLDVTSALTQRRVRLLREAAALLAL